MSNEEPIRANRGSDVNFWFNWKEIDPDSPDPENPVLRKANLDGWTVSLMDVSPELLALATVVLTDAETGLITIRVEWHDDLVVRKDYTLRVKLVKGIEDRSSSLIRIVYK